MTQTHTYERQKVQPIVSFCASGNSCTDVNAVQIRSITVQPAQAPSFILQRAQFHFLLQCFPFIYTAGLLLLLLLFCKHPKVMQTCNKTVFLLRSPFLPLLPSLACSHFQRFPLTQPWRLWNRFYLKWREVTSEKSCWLTGVAFAHTQLRKEEVGKMQTVYGLHLQEDVETNRGGVDRHLQVFSNTTVILCGIKMRAWCWAKRPEVKHDSICSYQCSQRTHLHRSHLHMFQHHHTHWSQQRTLN